MGQKRKVLSEVIKWKLPICSLLAKQFFFFFWVLSNEQNMINLMSVLNIFCLIFQLKGKYGEKLVIGY